jgi:stage V sporulation protein G
MAEKIASNRVSAKTGEITISFIHKSNPILNSVSLTERKHTMATATIEIKVLKVHKIDGDNRIKAFVDISINDALLIKALRVVKGKEGLFVSMPTEQGKNEKWYERVRCLNKDIREEISNAVLAAYNNG